MIPEKVQVNPISGQLDGQVNVTVESYSGRELNDPRELFCYTTDNTAHDMVEIEQLGKQEYIEVYEPLTYDVPAVGGVISIEGMSNSRELAVIGGSSALSYKLYINGILQSNWAGGLIHGDPGAKKEYSYRLEVTVSENRSDSPRSWNLYLTNNKNINTGYIVVNQAAGVRTYDLVIIDSFTYSPNPVSAAGGTSSPSLTYHQNWGWNGTTDDGGVITSGASVSYSGTNVNTSTGVVTVASKGTVVSNVTTASTPVVTVVLNGKTATSTCTVQQEENIIVSGSFIDKGFYSYDRIPASGGDSSPINGGIDKYDRIWTYSSGATIDDSGTSPTGYNKTVTSNGWSIASNLNGFTINTSNGTVTAPSRGTTIGNQWNSDTITQSETCTLIPASGYEYANTISITYKLTAVCSQEKNVPVSVVVNQDNPGFTYSPSTIPASGGVSTGNTSTKYDLTYTSWATLKAIHVGFTDPEGVTAVSNTSYTVQQSSAGAEIDLTPNTKVTWENRGTATGAARSVTVRRSYTIKVTISSTYGGGILTASSYCDATSTQSANTVSYGDITISGTPSVSDIPASGGSRNSATGLTASQAVSYSSGSSTTQNVPITYTTVTAASLGTTLKARTQVGAMVATATANGKTATKNIAVYQARNTITAFTVDFQFSYPKTTLSVSGETVNRTLNDFGYNVTFSSGSTAHENSGVANLSPSYVQTYSMTASTGWSINSSTGAVTVSALPQGSSSRVSGTISGVNTVTLKDNVNNVTLSNNKTYTYGTLTQAGNTIVSTQLIISAGGYPDSGWMDPTQWGSIPAKESYLYINGIRRYTYTDGTTRDESVPNLTVEAGLNSNVSWVTSWVNGGYKVASRGITIGNARSGELWWSSGGLESNHLSFTQVGNYVTKITPVTTVTYPKNVPASGGTVTPSRGTTYTLAFSSGSTSTTAPASTYGTLSTTYSYTGSAANGFSAPNASTGVMTASDRGSSAGATRNSGTVTQTATVKFVHAASYSTGGTVTGTATDTDYATQLANTSSVTYGDITINVATPVNLSSEGQTYTISPTATQTVTTTTSAGDSSTSTINVTGFTYSVVTAKSGYSLSGNTVTVTENTTGADRNGFVVKVSVSANGKSASKNITFNQPSSPVTYSEIEVSVSYPTIPAKGGTVYPTVTYRQTWGYNGSTTGGGVITTGAALGYGGRGVDPSNGAVSATTKGTVISTSTTVAIANISVGLNGKVKTVNVNVRQAENIVEEVKDLTNSFSYPTVVGASGGTSNPSGVTAYFTAVFSSEATAVIYSTYEGLTITYTRTYTEQGTTDATVNSSSGVVTWPSMGTSTVSQRQVTVSCAISCHIEHKPQYSDVEHDISGSSTAVCTQAGGNTYTIEVDATLSYPNVVPSGGGTSSPSWTVRYRVHYPSGSVSSWYTGNSAPSGCTVSYSYRYSIPSTSGASINTTTGVVTWANRTTTLGSLRSVVVTGTVTVGLSGSIAASGSDQQTANCSQEANTREQTSSESTSYSKWTVSVVSNRYTTSASPAPASGGTCTLTASASRTKTVTTTYTYVYSSGSTSPGGTDTDTTTETATPTLSVVSGSGFSLSGTTGTWEHRHKVIGDARSATVRATYSGVTADEIVYQQENKTTTSSTSSTSYGDWKVTVSANRYTTSSSPCPASGGTCTITSSASRSKTVTTTTTVTYTSGDSDVSSTPTTTTETATPILSISGSGASLSGTTVTWASRGTTTGSVRSATVTATYNGVSATEVVYQQANQIDSVSYGEWQVTCSGSNYTSASNPVPASGGSYTISGTASRTKTNVYTSGSTSPAGTETAVPDIITTGVGGQGSATNLGDSPVSASYNDQENVVSADSTYYYYATYGGVNSNPVIIYLEGNKAESVTYTVSNAYTGATTLAYSSSTPTVGTTGYSYSIECASVIYDNYSDGACISLTATVKRTCTYTSGYKESSVNVAVTAVAASVSVGNRFIGWITLTKNTYGYTGKSRGNPNLIESQAGVTVKVPSVSVPGGTDTLNVRYNISAATYFIGCSTSAALAPSKYIKVSTTGSAEEVLNLPTTASMCALSIHYNATNTSSGYGAVIGTIAGTLNDPDDMVTASSALNSKLQLRIAAAAATRYCEVTLRHDNDSWYRGPFRLTLFQNVNYTEASLANGPSLKVSYPASSFGTIASFIFYVDFVFQDSAGEEYTASSYYTSHPLSTSATLSALTASNRKLQAPSGALMHLNRVVLRVGQIAWTGSKTTASIGMNVSSITLSRNGSSIGRVAASSGGITVPNNSEDGSYNFSVTGATNFTMNTTTITAAGTVTITLS